MKYLLILLLLCCQPEEVEPQYEVYEPNIEELNNYCNMYGFDNYHGKFKEYVGNEVVCEPETFPDGTPAWKTKRYYPE